MAIAIIVGVLIAAKYFAVDGSYFLWLLVGCIVSFVSGFSAFSCGQWFQEKGRGTLLSMFLLLNVILLAIFLGFVHGVWWGVGALLAFYPASYTLALQFMQMLGFPIDRR